jgi:hypothetical protein
MDGWMGGWMVGEIGRDLISLNLISWHLLGETEKTHENSVIADLAEIRILGSVYPIGTKQK